MWHINFLGFLLPVTFLFGTNEEIQLLSDWKWKQKKIIGEKSMSANSVLVVSLGVEGLNHGSFQGLCGSLVLSQNA